MKKRVLFFLISFISINNLFSYSLVDIFWFNELFFSTKIVKEWKLLPLNYSTNFRVDKIMYERDNENIIQPFKDIDYDESIIPEETQYFYYENNKLTGYGNENEKFSVVNNKNVFDIILGNKKIYSYEFLNTNNDLLQINKIENEQSQIYCIIEKKNNSYTIQNNINDEEIITTVEISDTIKIDYGNIIYVFSLEGNYLKDYYKNILWDQLVTINKDYYIFHPSSNKLQKIDLLFNDRNEVIYICDDYDKSFLFTTYTILPCDKYGLFISDLNEIAINYLIPNIELDINKEETNDINLLENFSNSNDLLDQQSNLFQRNNIKIFLFIFCIVLFIIIVFIIFIKIYYKGKVKNGRNL